jgi:hypothetical protein
MVRRAKNLRMREFSWTILVSIHDNKFTWRKELKKFKDTIWGATLGHIYWEHVYNMPHHYNIVFYQLHSFFIVAGSCEALTHRIQIDAGV